MSANLMATNLRARQLRVQVRRRAYGYAEGIRRGCTIAELAEAESITKQAVWQVLSNACPLFHQPPPTVYKPPRSSSLGRPEWSIPGPELMRQAALARDEIRRSRKKW